MFMKKVFRLIVTWMKSNVINYQDKKMLLQIKWLFLGTIISLIMNYRKRFVDHLLFNTYFKSNTFWIGFSVWSKISIRNIILRVTTVLRALYSLSFAMFQRHYKL